MDTPGESRRVAEFERLTRDAVERVLAGGRLEDSRFEAKASVPEIGKLAERLAGHANSAQGRPITWIFGLDEDASEIRQDLTLDLADLTQRLQGKFDEAEGPRVSQGEWFSFGERGAVLAVEFDTSHPPYVVRQQPGGGDWSVVVPWREATRVRGIRRSELQRLLLRQVYTPSVRPLDVILNILGDDQVTIGGRLLFSLPAGSPPVYIPYEDVLVSVSTPMHRNLLSVDWGEFEYRGPDLIWAPGRAKEQERAHATKSGLVIEWVGSIPFGGSGDLIARHAMGPIKRSKQVTFGFEGRVLDSNVKAEVAVPLFVSSRDPWQWTITGHPAGASLT